MKRNNREYDLDFLMEEELITKQREYRKLQKKKRKPSKDEIWESRWN